MTSFNLATDPWVPVITPDGPVLMSLVDVFEHADQAYLAAGPLGDSALHRLLTAITYAALGSVTTTEYQVRSAVDTATVAGWVRTRRAVFDLFGQAPFGQDPTIESEPVPVGVLDPTVARKRPLLSDHRTLDDTHPLTFEQAALSLVINQAYSPGGKHQGWPTSFPGAALTGQMTWRPAGTIGEALRWAHIPSPGERREFWTYTDRGGQVTPAGPVDGYFWLSRRIHFVHNGTHVTHVRFAPGWRRAEAQGPTDVTPGRQDIVTATDPTKPLVGATGRREHTLVQAWARGSELSLAGQMRSHPGPHPGMVVTGQAMNQSAWGAVTHTTIPAEVLRSPSDETLTLLSKERPNPGRRIFHDTDVERTILMTPDAPDAAWERLRAERRPTPEPWQPRSEGLRTTRHTADTAEDALVWDDPQLAALEVPTDRVPDVAEDVQTLRRVFHRLRTDEDLCARLARQATTTNPGLSPFGLYAPPTPLIVTSAAIATWVAAHPNRADGPHHIATLTRWANLPVIEVKNITAAPLTGVRAPLVALLSRLPGPAAPNWVTLLDDLTHWDTPRVRATWLDRFYNPTKN